MLDDDFFARILARHPPRLRFDDVTESGFAAWSDAVCAKLRELLRIEDPPPQLASVEVVLREKCDGFRREKVVLTDPEFGSISAYVLLPVQAPGPLRGILCLHGHGGYFAGKDMVAGVEDTHPIARECAAALNYGYGVQLAREGFVTLCPDAFNFGERLFGKDRWTEKHVCSEYYPPLTALGFSSMGVTIRGHRLALDYLATRPEVVPTDMGCVGLSYGGISTIFLTVVEPRIRTAVVSGGMFSYAAEFAGNGGICPAQVVPGLLEWFDIPDLAAAIAPRPVLYEIMQRDSCMDFRAACAAYHKVAGAYQRLGVPERIRLVTPDTEHRYDGLQVPDFLRKN